VRQDRRMAVEGNFGGVMLRGGGGLELVELSSGLCVRPRFAGRKKIARRGPLAGAMGRAATVVDATAGFGGDSVLLARMGFCVTAVERHPAIAALLHDAVACSADPRVNAVRVHCADSCEFLGALRPPADAVYLDPMFPARRKTSALPAKEMQVLRRIAFRCDMNALLHAARNSGAGRVVLKRPPEAPAADCDLVFGGKLARYEVYLRR